MTKSAWIGIAAALGVVLVVVIWFVKAPTNRMTGDSVATRIGVILPLTGDAAVYGKALQNGIELARDEITLGTSSEISLIYEDDQGQSTHAVSAVRRLINIEKVPAIIGGAMSSTAEAIIPICENSKVVLLSPTATKPSRI